MDESILSKIAPLLGLSIKANVARFGFEGSVRLIQKNKAKLVITAKDTGENTLKRIRNYCNENKVLLVSVGFSDDWKKILKVNQKIIALKNHPLSEEIINVFGSMNG